MGSTFSKRIPDALEAAVAEVLFVDGGELSDALLDEDERGAPIVGATAGEIGFAEFRPEGIVKCPAIRRKADDLPTGMLAEGLADIGGGGGRERLGKHGGVPQEHVEFEQDELTDGNILALLKRFEKRRSPRVMGIPDFDGGQKDVGIQRDHRSARLRLLSSSAAMSCRESKGTLMPPASTRGSAHAPREWGQSLDFNMVVDVRAVYVRDAAWPDHQGFSIRERFITQSDRQIISDSAYPSNVRRPFGD